jgi:hypothetical protein
VLLTRLLSTRRGDDGTEFIALHLDQAGPESLGGVPVSPGPAK